MHIGEQRLASSELPRGRAFGSLALGIVALVFSPFVVGIIPGITGFVLGRKHLQYGLPSRKIACVGMALSVTGTLISSVTAILFCVCILPNMAYVRTVTIPSPFVQAAAALPPETKERWAQYDAAKQVELALMEKWIGVEAPDIAFSDVDQKEEYISDLRGKKVLLAFLEPVFLGETEEFPFGLLARLNANAKDASVYGVFFSCQSDSFKQEPFIHYKFPMWTTEGRPPSPPYKVLAVPVFMVIDRKGVIQNIFGGREPEGQITAALASNDYQGEPRTAPVPDQTGLEPPEAAGELIKKWEVEGGLTSEKTVQRAGANAGSELVLAGGDGYSILDDEGGVLFRHEWPEKRFPVPLVAACTVDGKRRIAVWGAEKGDATGGAPIQVIDDDGNSLWSRGSSGVSMWSTLTWVDLDGNGSHYLMVSEDKNHSVIYSDSGSVVREWGATPERGQATGGQTALRPGKGAKGLGMAPLGLFEDARRGRILVGVGPMDNEVFLETPKGKELDRWRVEGEGFRFMRVIKACKASDSQKALVGISANAGPCDQGYFSVLDEEGKFLWTRKTAGGLRFDGSGIAFGDCRGDGDKEWLILDDDYLLVVSAYGKLLCHVLLPTIQGFGFEKGKDGKDVSVPMGIPPEEIRIVSRPGKEDLVLMRTIDHWVAYQLRLTASN